MNERDVNGTQADEVLVDETPADSGRGEGRDVEKMRRLGMIGLLRELVRVQGRMEAAELLGVNYRTLVKAEESGEITWRMGVALERLMREADEAEVARLREVVEGLEERVTSLEGSTEERRASVQGRAEAGPEGRGATRGGERVRAPARDRDTGTKAQDAQGDRAGRSETRAAPPVAGLHSKGRERRRLDPEVVTEGAAEDDEEVYGVAWPLVEEWRDLRAGHLHEGKSLSWLVTQERLLTLELAMLEEHGLTLPPETQALRGFGRRGQTSWRWKALYDTRRALRRRRLLRWVRRVCTLGLWRK